MSNKELQQQGNNPFGKPAKQQINAIAEASQQREIQEVQAAMIIAKKFPRDQVAAMDRILQAFTRNTLAEGALYSYARGGTEITGPSIRAAEAIAQMWGNIQFGVRELEQRNGESTVEAFAWDIESNTRQVKVFQVSHVRHTKRGTYKLEDPRDIYEMVANQGARRLRACILGVIPGDVIEEATKQAEVTLKTTADTSKEAIAKMIEAFSEYGVTKAMIEKRIQRRLDAVTPALMIQMKKIYASLRDGMSVASEWFEANTAQQTNQEQELATKTESVKSKLQANEPEAEPQGGEITPAYIEAQISKATNQDELDTASDLINTVEDKEAKKELIELAGQKQAEIG